jgi:deoxyribonuclease V
VSGLATVGAAKSRLIGEHTPVAHERGARVALMHEDEVIGAVLRTRTGARPLYVSAGHRMTLEFAIELVLACTPRYRLPETTRAAHRLASH